MSFYAFTVRQEFQNVKNNLIPRFSYRSLLTGATYDLAAITKMNQNEIKARSLDMECVHTNVHCLPAEDNVIDVFFGVNSAEECQLTCAYHSQDCVMFTWFDHFEETFPASCFLYSKCSRAGQSLHTVTGPPTCLCSKNMACQGVRHNFVGFQENIESEKDCQTLCLKQESCNFYTWFDFHNRVFANYCFLFNSCDKVACNCVACSSGPPSCAPEFEEIVPFPTETTLTADGLSSPSKPLKPNSTNSKRPEDSKNPLTTTTELQDASAQQIGIELDTGNGEEIANGNSDNNHGPFQNIEGVSQGTNSSNVNNSQGSNQNNEGSNQELNQNTGSTNQESNLNNGISNLGSNESNEIHSQETNHNTGSISQGTNDNVENNSQESNQNPENNNQGSSPNHETNIQGSNQNAESSSQSSSIHTQETNHNTENNNLGTNQNDQGSNTNTESSSIGSNQNAGSSSQVSNDTSQGLNPNNDNNNEDSIPNIQNDSQGIYIPNSHLENDDKEYEQNSDSNSQGTNQNMENVNQVLGDDTDNGISGSISNTESGDAQSLGPNAEHTFEELNPNFELISNIEDTGQGTSESFDAIIGDSNDNIDENKADSNKESSDGVNHSLSPINDSHSEGSSLSSSSHGSSLINDVIGQGMGTGSESANGKPNQNSDQGPGTLDLTENQNTSVNEDVNQNSDPVSENSVINGTEEAQQLENNQISETTDNSNNELSQLNDDVLSDNGQTSNSEHIGISTIGLVPIINKPSPVSDDIQNPGENIGDDSTDDLDSQDGQTSLQGGSQPQLIEGNTTNQDIEDNTSHNELEIGGQLTNEMTEAQDVIDSSSMDITGVNTNETSDSFDIGNLEISGHNEGKQPPTNKPNSNTSSSDIFTEVTNQIDPTNSSMNSSIFRPPVAGSPQNAQLSGILIQNSSSVDGDISDVLSNILTANKPDHVQNSPQTNNSFIIQNNNDNVIINLPNFGTNLISSIRINSTETVPADSSPQTGTSQGIKTAILNYMPSLKWLFVFIENQTEN